MKLAIMQPYFLPYFGYFQLINSVDTFVFYDDVTFIKQGWVNRNRILLNKKDFLFTLELKGASSFKNINEVEIGNNRNKLLKTFTHAYNRAPYFNEIEPLLLSILNSEENNLSKYILNVTSLINDYLGITTKIIMSSDIEKNIELKGESKVIDICKRLNAKIYINSIGGKELYSKENFANDNIELKFLQPNNISYTQFGDDFIPWLSIIDVLMFNDKKAVMNFLSEYKLV